MEKSHAQAAMSGGDLLLCNKALLTQSIRVTIFNPIRGSGLTMPIGPVADDADVTVTIDGEAFTGFDFASGLRP